MEQLMGGDMPLKLDLKGLKCPHPVLRSRKKLRDLQSGTLLEVETTDPLANIDIPHMCNQEGHMLLLCEKLGRGHRFIIRKI
jgi:tRNA 2-thiouridine synthesizing protein A